MHTFCLKVSGFLGKFRRILHYTCRPAYYYSLSVKLGSRKEAKGEKIPKKDAKKMHERKALPKNGRGEAFVMGAKCERKNDESRKLRPTPANDPPVNPSTHPCFSLGLPTDR
ncbi:hypothetical protein TNCV_4683141 [Trichonephila clavipes]|nr:hypothetical protein TNCV_4683141 [Trichonephila clavipes]